MTVAIIISVLLAVAALVLICWGLLENWVDTKNFVSRDEVEQLVDIAVQEAITERQMKAIKELAVDAIMRAQR